MKWENIEGEIQTIYMMLERKYCLQNCGQQRALGEPEHEAQGTQ